MKKLLFLFAIVAYFAVGCTPDEDGLKDNTILGDSVSGDSISGDSIPDDSILGDSGLDNDLQDFLTNCPNNEIRYVTTNDSILNQDFTNKTNFGDSKSTKLVEHVYANGYGCLKFSGDVTAIPAWCFENSATLQTVCLPNSVEKIGAYAFGRCEGLESINIPVGVTEIGNYAFEMCLNLASITVPGTVENVGQYAFSRCSALKDVTISEGVQIIGMKAFEHCAGIETIEIPSTVIEIVNYAFDRCSNLKNVYCKAECPPVCNDSFDAYVQNIYVPAESVEMYMDEWWDLADKIRAFEF